MDPLLPKHIMSSVAEYFRPIVSGLGLKLYVEGVDNVTEETYQQDSVVLHVNGPVLHEGSNATDDEWYGVEIHLLITDIMKSTDAAYSIYEWCGTLQAALQDPLPIYEFDQNGIVANDVLIDCLQPDITVRNNIRTVNYQIVDKDIPVRQMSVHGRFILYL